MTMYTKFFIFPTVFSQKFGNAFSKRVKKANLRIRIVMRVKFSRLFEGKLEVMPMFPNQLKLL